MTLYWKRQSLVQDQTRSSLRDVKSHMDNSPLLSSGLPLHQAHNISRLGFFRLNFNKWSIIILNLRWILKQACSTQKELVLSIHIAYPSIFKSIQSGHSSWITPSLSAFILLWRPPGPNADPGTPSAFVKSCLMLEFMRKSAQSRMKHTVYDGICEALDDNACLSMLC